MQKSFYMASLLFVVLVLLTGCNSAPSAATNSNDSTSVPPKPPQSEATPQSQTKVQTSESNGFQLVQQFLEAVRLQDSKKLADNLVNSNPAYYRDYLHIDESVTKQFLKMLSVDMDLGSIQVVLNESGDRQETYIVTGTKNGSDPVTIPDLLYVSVTDSADQPSLDWSYIRYLPYAEQLAEEYVRLIQAGDAEQLSRFSVVDDIALTIADAKKLIAIYATYFDNLEQAELIYTGGFQFKVQDGLENSHTFRIVYGDGLMGIDDTFAPAMTAL